MLYDFPKLIELDEYTKHSEPTIQIVRPRDITVPHIKVASEALDYIKHVKPQHGKTIILVLAMTAGEYYGANRNGDAWPEEPLIAGGKTRISANEVLPKHYKTFETNARVFRHHINKDPAKSIGDILKAFYNWPMHRVELLLALDNLKAEDIVEQIERGEFPAVSMGCFCAGTLVTMADSSRKPIEEIKVGDVVLTHKGNSKKVTKTHKRAYRGPIYRIKPAVYPEIVCTEEHPFWVAERASVKKKTDKGYHRWDPDAKPVCDWVHAKCLEEDHLLFEPIITEEETPDYVSRAFARLFGYYLAEGHVAFGKKGKPIRISLSVNKTDAVLGEIEELCSEFGTRNAPNIYPRPHCESAMTIDISDEELATLCLEHGGRYGRHKRLSYSVMRWSPDMQREMVGAYANGDGCGTAAGALLLSTASPALAWQMVAVLHRLGIIPSIQNIMHKAGSGFSHKNTYEWVTHIGKQWAQQLRDVCSKVKPVEILARRNDRHIFDSQIATPIRSIEAEFGEMDVYNFEVEDDESYVAGGMSVHNCKIKYDICDICGNIAPSRAQYCDHAKFMLGDYLPNGKQVKVWNPSPRFFDLSCVRRPADRIGFMMKKVAESAPNIRSSAELGEYAEFLSGKLSDARKLSVIDKVIHGDTVATKEDDGDLNVVKSYADNVAQPAANEMPPLDDKLVHELIRYRPAEVLSTLASMGIFLTTPEFIKFFVWKADPSIKLSPGVLQRATEVQRHVFDALAQNPELIEEILSTDFLDISPENVNPALAEKCSSLLEKRSQLDRFVRKRLVTKALRKVAEDTELPRGVGRWGTLEVIDPTTGERYVTTRGAISDAKDALPKAKMHALAHNLLGGGALMSGAYKLFGVREPMAHEMQAYRRAAAMSTHPYLSTTGVEVPVGTELAKAGMDTKSAIMRLAHDRAVAASDKKATKLAQSGIDFSTANFDMLANWFGKVICL